MPRYILEDGEETTADDPRRLVWYSARCGFYSDDWDSLANACGIPICPGCDSPGFMIGAAVWFQRADEFEAAGHPHYAEFLKAHPGECSGTGFMKRYEKFANQRALNN